jgi:hypothetical protein
VISVFGDESSSTVHATYGLFAIADGHQPALESFVATARAMLGALGTEPLHCKVLFHEGRRRKSAFKNSSRADVEKACSVLLHQIASLNVAFYFGRVARDKVPKILHVPIVDDKNQSEVIDARLKLELPHLQFFAYVAAATRACHTLPHPATRLVVDRNKTMVRWFNENRQVGRLLESLFIDSNLPQWPAMTSAPDANHSGLQVADLLTYYATRQFFDPRFAHAFDVVRHKTQFMVYEFDPQVYQQYSPPPGVSVKPLAKPR